MSDFFITNTVFIPLFVAGVCGVFAVCQLVATFTVFRQNLSSQITNLIFNVFSYGLIVYGIAWGVSKAGSAGCYLVGGSASSTTMAELQNSVSRATIIAVSALVINFAAGLNFLNYLSNNKFLYFSDWRLTYENAPGMGYFEMLLRSIIASLFFIITVIVSASDFDLGKAVFAFGNMKFSYIQNAMAYLSGSGEVVRTCEILIRGDESFERLGFVEASKQILEPIGQVALLSLVLYASLLLWVLVNARAMWRACTDCHIVDCRKPVVIHSCIHVAMAILGILVSWLIADIYSYGDVLYSDFFYSALSPNVVYALGWKLGLAQVLAYILVGLIILKPVFEICVRRIHPVAKSLKLPRTPARCA